MDLGQPEGEYGVEQLKGISKKWTDAMDISEDTATVMARKQDRL